MLLIAFIVLSLFLLVTQTVLFSFLPAWMGAPDLIFLLVVYLAYHYDFVKGAVLVFFMGLLLDIYSGILVGIYPTIYLVIFFFLKILSRHVANETTYQAPLVVISYLFNTSAIFIIASLFAPAAEIDWSWRAMLLQLLMLAIMVIPFFALCDRYASFVTKKMARWKTYGLQGGSNRFKS
jgi:rod shape-determining protein MreD